MSSGRSPGGRPGGGQYIKPIGFVIGLKNIYLTTDNGRMLIIDTKTGKTNSILKIDNDKILEYYAIGAGECCLVMGILTGFCYYSFSFFIYSLSCFFLFSCFFICRIFRFIFCFICLLFNPLFIIICV